MDSLPSPGAPALPCLLTELEFCHFARAADTNPFVAFLRSDMETKMFTTAW